VYCSLLYVPDVYLSSPRVEILNLELKLGVRGSVAIGGMQCTYILWYGTIPSCSRATYVVAQHVAP
jgi:hypothetical protein